MTKSGTRSLMAPFIIMALILGAGLYFMNLDRGGTGKPADKPDELIEMYVDFEPRTRQHPVIVIYIIGTGDPVQEAVFQATWSSPPFQVAAGTVVALKAAQPDAGKLSCWILRNGKRVARKERTTFGVVECVS